MNASFRTAFFALLLLARPSFAEEAGVVHVEALPAPPVAVAIGEPGLAYEYLDMTWGPGTLASSSMLMGRLFPPTLVMQRQRELELTDRQAEAIKKEMRGFQSQVVDVQWDLQSSQADLQALLASDAIDGGKANAAIDRVLAAENQLKKLHLAMLINIRNQLTKEQVDKLQTTFSTRAMNVFTRRIDAVPGIPVPPPAPEAPAAEAPR